MKNLIGHKPYLILAIVTVIFTITATYATPKESLNALEYDHNSPQVCQFSLSSYTGIISNNRTSSFKVRLSCTYEQTMRATVVVYIDEEAVASTVVEIPAGKIESGDKQIPVGPTYNGKKYQLIVQ